MTIPESIAKEDHAKIAAVRRVLLDIVSETENRLTPKALENRLRQQFSVPRSTFKTAVDHLVADGELVYSYTFGCSFVERSFNRPVRIAKSIILTPPGAACEPASGDIVVKLQQGVSFGIGDHPTTRLAARGIERVLSTNDFFHKKGVRESLDIGTGSGVLAIIAVLLGVKRAMGIDIDPCAISESKQNIALNHLEHQIVILDQPLERIDKTFSIITANLRYSTLKRLSCLVAERTEPGGAVVVSGIRVDEVAGLLKTYENRRLTCVWKETEKNWAGLALVKP